MARPGRFVLPLGFFALSAGLARPVNAQQDDPAGRALGAMRAAASVELSVSRSPRTRLATFLTAPPGRSIPVPDQAASTPERRATSFVEAYGAAFGLRGARDVAVSRTERDVLGIDHVRMRQVRSGIPVTGGDLILHMRGNRVLAVNGKTLRR